MVPKKERSSLRVPEISHGWKDKLTKVNWRNGLSQTIHYLGHFHLDLGGKSKALDLTKLVLWLSKQLPRQTSSRLRVRWRSGQ